MPVNPGKMARLMPQFQPPGSVPSLSESGLTNNSLAGLSPGGHPELLRPLDSLFSYQIINRVSALRHAKDTHNTISASTNQCSSIRTKPNAISEDGNITNASDQTSVFD